MKIQCEDFIDCLKEQFPGHDFVTPFDQSSGHAKKREDGLNAKAMNQKHGDKKPPMRESEVVPLMLAS